MLRDAKLKTTPPNSSGGFRLVASARFAAFLIVFAGVAAAVFDLIGGLRCTLVGFDAAALLFMLSLIPMLRAPSADVMRRHADDNTAKRVMLLIITVTIMIVILVTVEGILRERSAMQPATYRLMVVTLGLYWFFSNSVYSLHYADLYYADHEADGADDRGLRFPSTQFPEYADFVYFAFTIGMTFQTFGVKVTTRPMRRVVRLHAIAAFVFNVGVLCFAMSAFDSTRR
jgi:uncharacterized membrane protein